MWHSEVLCPRALQRVLKMALLKDHARAEPVRDCGFSCSPRAITFCALLRPGGFGWREMVMLSELGRFPRENDRGSRRGVLHGAGGTAGGVRFPAFGRVWRCPAFCLG